MKQAQIYILALDVYHLCVTLSNRGYFRGANKIFSFFRFSNNFGNRKSYL